MKTIRFRVPKAKRRAGVLPTKKEKSKKDYSRKVKHKDEIDWKKGDD
jgi:hypothetical protein